MVECPVCHASNPPGSAACSKCGSVIDIGGATIAPNPRYNLPAQPPRETPAQSPDPEMTVAAGSGASAWSAPARSPHESSAPLGPGSVLAGRYEILKSLGEGGMGTVYKSRDRELDRLVAIKVIRTELAGREDVLARFKQELILARQVTHKNVIRIFDLGMGDGRKFITMDYIDGRDLKSILVERGKMTPERAVNIIRQICRGLEAAHAEGVVHRDLKPQNIMVDKDDHVWVMDFGLARSLETSGLTRSGMLMGTPDYMSPEQARGEKADVRSDLFSLGVIFYETLTGRLPFPADSVMSALIKRVREKAKPPVEVDPSIPQRLSDIATKCLETDPAKRYQTTGELLADLTEPAPAAASVTQSVLLPQMALAPGSAFGPRYTIEALIGEGGMGKVFKAHDSDLDRTVALKLVRQDLAGNPEAIQRFKQELLLASRISHRNILRIHDLGDVGGVKFISMAYVDGKDLQDVIAGCGRLPLDRAVNIAKQLASALEAAHAEGVVHRDLKPRNVLVDRADHIYVSDFGLAKSLESAAASAMTRTGEVMGTPRYMSPEQAESKAVDHRADIYSFGVMLYEMVTGDAPFSGESMLQVMYQHVSQQPKNPKEKNPELPDYIAAIILRCLEKDPARRYQSAREVLEDLEAERAPKRLPDVKTTRKPARLWLWVAAGAAALVIALLVAVTPVRETIVTAIRGGAGGHKGKTYVAVLPFRVLGDQASLGYVADGVVEALSAKLFQLKDVYVASAADVASAEEPPASDASRAPGSDKAATPAAAAPPEVSRPASTRPPPSQEKIARALGVQMLVTGSVQGAGDNLSLTVSLDDVRQSRRIWSQQFPMSRQDLLTVEDQVYNKLVDALEVKRTNDEMARSAMRPTEDISAYDLYLRSRNLLRGQRDEKNIDAAMKMYTQATQRDPKFALAYAGLSDACLYMFDLKKDSFWTEKALGAALQADRYNDSLPEVHFALGSVYTMTGQSGLAIAELKRALALAPNSDDSYRRLGNAYLAAGNETEAITAFQKAVEVNPYFWHNHNQLGRAYFQLGQNDRALAEFQKVAELEPDREAGYANTGAVYFQQGKWNECIAAFQKANRVQENFRAYSNIGVAYFYLGKYSDAAKMFEKSVSMNPNQAFALGNLADAYRQLGQPAKAMATYDEAITLELKAVQVNPRDATALGELGLYYAKKGAIDRALRFIAQARAIDANDNDLMYSEAVIFALAGRAPDALKSLKAAIEGGYSLKQAENDPDLKSVVSRPEFQKLVQPPDRKSG